MIFDSCTLQDGVRYDTANGIKDRIYVYIKENLNLDDMGVNLHYKGLREDSDDMLVMSFLFQIVEKN